VRAKNKGDVSHTVAPGSRPKPRSNVHREVNKDNYPYGLSKRKLRFIVFSEEVIAAYGMRIAPIRTDL